jgi:hypothetical protein
MELNDLMLILGLNCVLSGVFSVMFAFIVGYVKDNSLSRRMTEVEHDFDKLVDTMNSKSGVSAKAEKKERTQMAMAEAMVLFQSGKPKEDIFKELLAKYPDVAMDMAAKGIKL